VSGSRDLAAERRSRASVQLHCLVDQHDRDVVLDAIDELARLADEPVLLRGELEVTLALGAGQNLKQFLADPHHTPPGSIPTRDEARR
jgi:hypothetical protein